MIVYTSHLIIIIIKWCDWFTFVFCRKNFVWIEFRVVVWSDWPVYDSCQISPRKRQASEKLTARRSDLLLRHSSWLEKNNFFDLRPLWFWVKNFSFLEGKTTLSQICGNPYGKSKSSSYKVCKSCHIDFVGHFPLDFSTLRIETQTQFFFLHLFN